MSFRWGFFGRMKNRNMVDSINNAISGIIYAIKFEKNMKIHVVAAVIVLIMSLFFDISRIEFLIVCATVCLVLICELINTAVEILVDIIVDVYHPKAKIVKDVSAGAVLMASFLSLVVAYFIFLDKFSLSFEKGITIIRNSSIHITVIALLLTIIIVLSLKAYFKKGTFMRGGMPSGHSAIAASISTAISLTINNMNVIILVLILSVLVIESRLETRIHTLYEVIMGSLLGFLITVLLFRLFF